MSHPMHESRLHPNALPPICQLQFLVVRSCGTVGLSQRYTLSTFITNFIIDIHLVMKKRKFNCNSQEITSIVITKQDYNNCWLLFISSIFWLQNTLPNYSFDCKTLSPTCSSLCLSCITLAAASMWYFLSLLPSHLSIIYLLNNK